MLSEILVYKINQKVQELESLKPLNQIVQAQLAKKFRLEFNFNSNHLEGNTLTYTETELLLIFDQTDGSHEYRELMEMEAHDVALKMIEDEAADIERPLTEIFLKALNRTILVKPFWKDAITSTGEPTRKQIMPGTYKTTPNSVQLANGEIFHYTHPSDVLHEIAELVKWYNVNPDNYSPVELAAIFHYRFVRIHPFDDGNGRCARLLMNYILLKNNFPLVVIKSNEKKEYLLALNKADTGDLQAFVNYIGYQILWSLDISIKAAKGEDIEEEDDLDKEIDLLIKDLKSIPDEYDKRRSIIEATNVFHKSALPILIDLDDKLSRIASLFVETRIELETIEREANGNQLKFIVDIEKGREFANYESFTNPDLIESMSINITLSALKKVTDTKDISASVYFEMTDYHYHVFVSGEIQPFVKLPYGRFVNKEQISKISKYLMHAIIGEIKEATNLS